MGRDASLSVMAGHDPATCSTAVMPTGGASKKVLNTEDTEDDEGVRIGACAPLQSTFGGRNPCRRNASKSP